MWRQLSRPFLAAAALVLTVGFSAVAVGPFVYFCRLFEEGAVAQSCAPGVAAALILVGSLLAAGAVLMIQWRSYGDGYPLERDPADIDDDVRSRAAPS